MRTARLVILFLLVILLTDAYVIRNVILLIDLGGLEIRLNYALGLYILVSLLILAGLIYAGTHIQKSRDPHIYTRLLWIMGLFLMTFLPKLVFSITGILADGLLLLEKITGSETDIQSARATILSVGVVLAALVLLIVAMGMVRGRYAVKVNRHIIKSPRLPESFDGLRIVQMSDMHISAFFYNRNQVKKWIRRIGEMQPDLFLFTGDMVNNFAEELDGFTQAWRSLKPKMGKYAVLGNHDYGKYYRWKNKEDEARNLDQLKENLRKSGFDLLLNEHRMLQKNGSQIALIGVENWGKPPFPQYGDLELAIKDIEGDLFKILMSHDPAHWEKEVRKRKDIDLTLSGHTHGMQFGFELGKLRWSPSRWQYRHWAGLYRRNGRYLYVNRGFGYVGYPGRVGIRPEITELTLRRSKS